MCLSHEKMGISNGKFSIHTVCEKIQVLVGEKKQKKPFTGEIITLL